MNKFLFVVSIVLLLIVSSSNVIAQNDSIKKYKNYKNDETLTGEGKFIADVYYGYPYLAGRIVKTVFDNNTSNNSDIESVKNLNHLGAKFEYMITDEIGLGLEYTYASVSIFYKSEKFVNNQYQTYHYKAQLIKQRALARVNIHFATTEKFDPYGTIGFGYKISTLKTNNIDDQQLVKNYNISGFNLFPVAVRLGIGARYYFSEYVGVSAEVGIGGPCGQIGLCAKF